MGVSILPSSAIKNDIPDDFFCSLTKKVMKHPLYSRYGHTFESDAILLWLMENNNQCPMTKQTLYVTDLIRHRALECRMKAWNRTYESGTNQIEEMDDDEENHNIILTCKASDLILGASKQKQKLKTPNKGFIGLILGRTKRNSVLATAA
jgi:U-box domain